MEDIQKYSQQITNLITQYEQLVTGSVIYEDDRTKWKQMCLDKQKKLKNLIFSMKQQMDELPPSSTKPYQSVLKQHQQTKMSAVIQQYQRKLKLPVKNQMIRKSIPKLQQDDQRFYTNRTVESYFYRGDKEMARMEDAVQNMNKELQEALYLAEEVNIELNRQIQQVDRIQDTVKDTKSTLKRADRIISFFAKAAQCDKCILALVLMNLLALMALIILITKRR